MDAPPCDSCNWPGGPYTNSREKHQASYHPIDPAERKNRTQCIHCTNSWYSQGGFSFGNHMEWCKHNAATAGGAPTMYRGHILTSFTSDSWPSTQQSGSASTPTSKPIHARNPPPIANVLEPTARVPNQEMRRGAGSREISARGHLEWWNTVMGSPSPIAPSSSLTTMSTRFENLPPLPPPTSQSQFESQSQSLAHRHCRRVCLSTRQARYYRDLV